jgi:hypothetical protein
MTHLCIMDRMSISLSKPQLAYLQAEASGLAFRPAISSGASSIGTEQADVRRRSLQGARAGSVPVKTGHMHRIDIHYEGM